MAYTYTYDSVGQLQSALGSLNSAPMAGRQYEYAYDSAGNRLTVGHNGVNGAQEQYWPNPLNQITAKENNAVPVQGTANASASVEVTSDGINTAASRAGNYWGAEAMESNAGGPAYQSVNVIAALAGAGSGGSDLMSSIQQDAFLAPGQQSLTYDADGNLSSDGVWNYTYDAENRLIQMTPVTAVVDLTESPTNYPAQQLKFTYDYLGRRVDKQVYTYNGGWMPSSETKFVYAGWNLLAETNASGTLQRTYAWGLDVAGSLTATGGIGALAEIVDHGGGAAYLPTYDGNGNVAALIKASDGSVAAIYEYSPYGQLLRQEGAFASSNPFRFSTHYWDQESGDVYYGYRYYSPNLGRFLNRDPLEEQGGLNLYAFVGNDPANHGDVLGLQDGGGPAEDSGSDANGCYHYTDNAGIFHVVCPPVQNPNDGNTTGSGGQYDHTNPNGTVVLTPFVAIGIPFNNNDDSDGSSGFGDIGTTQGYGMPGGGGAGHFAFNDSHHTQSSAQPKMAEVQVR